MIASASCSIVPESRKSAIVGRLSSRFSSAGQLRQRNDRNVQFFREPLQCSRNLANLVDAGAGISVRRPHDVHVIDNDGTKPAALTFQGLLMPADARRDLRDGQARGRIDLSEAIRVEAWRPR